MQNNINEDLKKHQFFFIIMLCKKSELSYASWKINRVHDSHKIKFFNKNQYYNLTKREIYKWTQLNFYNTLVQLNLNLGGRSL